MGVTPTTKRIRGRPGSPACAQGLREVYSVKKKEKKISVCVTITRRNPHQRQTEPKRWMNSQTNAYASECLSKQTARTAMPKTQRAICARE